MPVSEFSQQVVHPVFLASHMNNKGMLIMTDDFALIEHTRQNPAQSVIVHQRAVMPRSP
jgi:hypothetical protein